MKEKDIKAAVFAEQEKTAQAIAAGEAAVALEKENAAKAIVAEREIASKALTQEKEKTAMANYPIATASPLLMDFTETISEPYLWQLLLLPMPAMMWSSSMQLADSAGLPVRKLLAGRRN